jgi:hypothetical protein
VIAGVSSVCLALRQRVLGAYERAVTVSLLALSFYSVRYALFLGYTLMVSLPLLFSRPRGTLEPRGLCFKSISCAVGAASVLALLSILPSFDSHISALWPPQTSRLVAALAGASGSVFAEMRHADRLLWQSPALAGRVAFDARFELLDAAEAQAISDLLAGRSLEQGLRKYAVFVVSEPSAGRLLERAGFALSARDGEVTVYSVAPK